MPLILSKLYYSHVDGGCGNLWPRQMYLLLDLSSPLRIKMVYNDIIDKGRFAKNEKRFVHRRRRREV